MNAFAVRRFRCSSLAVAICAVGAVVSVYTVFSLYGKSGYLPLLAVTVLLAPVFIIGFADAVTILVILEPDQIRIRSSFRSRVHKRSEFSGVFWEKGMPVVLERRAGGSVPLPALNISVSGLVAMLRAWLGQPGV